MLTKASLYLRVKLPDGSYKTAKPAFTATGRIRPGYAIIDGNAHSFQNVTYALRFKVNGKQVWESVGAEAHAALAACQRRNHRFTALALGLAETPHLATQSEPVIEETSARDMGVSANLYLEEMAQHKASKTHFAYALAIRRFRSQCGKRTMEAVTRQDVLDYVKWESKQGNADRTSNNRVCYLRAFFKHFAVPFPLANKDFSRVCYEL